MSVPSVIVLSPTHGPSVVLFEKTTLDFFVSITAANIIDQVSRMPDKKGVGTEPISGAGKLLSERVRWADHGHLNVLQVQVEFLYAWVSEAIRDYMGSGLYLMSRGQIELIAEALSVYQVYKTKVINWGRADNGEIVGAGTEFVKKDWTDQNAKFLELLALVG